MHYSSHTDFFSIHANVYAEKSWKGNCPGLNPVTQLWKDKENIDFNTLFYQYIVTAFKVKSIIRYRYSLFITDSITFTFNKRSNLHLLSLFCNNFPYIKIALKIRQIRVISLFYILFFVLTYTWLQEKLFSLFVCFSKNFSLKSNSGVTRMAVTHHRQHVCIFFRALSGYLLRSEFFSTKNLASVF